MRLCATSIFDRVGTLINKPSKDSLITKCENENIIATYSFEDHKQCGLIIKKKTNH